MGRKAVAVHCDIAQFDAAEKVVQAALDAFGRLDILVNNAGMNWDGVCWKMSEEQWDRVIDVDLKGTFMLSQAAGRVMVDQGIAGSIVNVSSVMAVLALADQVPYCAAKGGVNQLTRAMALALAEYGIRVNAIGPGPVLTELMQRVVSNEEKEAELLSRLPLGRIAEPVEIARAAVFLAGDDASFFTGQCIYPDGGRMIQAFSRKMEQ